MRAAGILRAIETSDLPPPYPADTRARGFGFDLDPERIEQSDTWALASPEQRPWLLMLWYRAWQQIPAGAFIDDDAVIAARLGLPLSTFQMWRPLLMRGWRKHSDGLLYHPVIVDRVLKVVKYRDDVRRRKQESRERAAKAKQEAEASRVTDAMSTGCHDMSRVTSSDDRVTVTPCHDTSSSSSSSSSSSLKEVILRSPLRDTSSGLQPELTPAQAEIELKPPESVPDVTRPDQWDFRSPPSRGQEARYVLAFLNKITGHQYRDVEANTKLIRQRLKESSVRDAKRLIVFMADRWEDDDKMREYLRPATLFSRTNYHQYLGQLPPVGASDADAN